MKKDVMLRQRDKKKLTKEQYYDKYEKPITLKEFLIKSKGLFIGSIVGIMGIGFGLYYITHWLGYVGISVTLSIILFIINNTMFYKKSKRKDLYELLHTKKINLVCIELGLLLWSAVAVCSVVSFVYAFNIARVSADYHIIYCFVSGIVGVITIGILFSWYDGKV